MSEQQLDFFSETGVRAEQPLQPPRAGLPVAAAELDDDALIAAIPESSLSDSAMLAMEAGQRRLAAAVSPLAALCRRLDRKSVV